MALAPSIINLTFPGGLVHGLPNTPGITYIVGPNGAGKSRAMADAAMANPNELLYLPPNRDVLREPLQHVNRQAEDQFHAQWASRDTIARYWSRGVRIPALRALAMGILERMGLPQRVTTESAGGQLVFSSVDAGQTYSAVFEASGVLNLPTLGLAIYDPSRNTVLIDEPEHSLHPQAQHVLLQLLRDVAGGQGKHFILSTHSPSMIDLRSSDDLARVIFVRRPDRTSSNRQVWQVTPSYAHHFEALIPGLNAYKREAFFADNVILVEGITDRDHLQAILQAGGYAGSFGRTSIMPLDGFGDQARYSGLLRTLGVRPFVISDRDVIYPSSGAQWATGRMENDAFRWQGWVPPDLAEKFSRDPTGTPVSTPATSDPAQFQSLNSLVARLREAISTAFLAISDNPDPLNGSVVSLAAVRALTEPREAASPLLDAALFSNDWRGTPVESQMTAVLSLWQAVTQQALTLDILVLSRGSLENYYRFGGLAQAGKTARSRAEVADIARIYASATLTVDADYAEIVTALRTRNIIERAKGGVPAEAAAAIAGKIQEFHLLIFRDGNPREHLNELVSSHRLEELSPGIEVVSDELDATPPMLELNVPILNGLLPSGGRLRLLKGVEPNVFTDLLGA